MAAIETWPVTSGIEMHSYKSMAFDGEVITTGSGKKRSNTNQLLPKWNIEVKFGILTDANYKIILGFFALLRGGNTPFYWLDPDDNTETGIQLPKLSSGKYQCVMKWGSFVEAVEKVDQLKVYVNGTLQAANAYSVSGGVITFATAPANNAVVTADYRYYWKVHIPAKKIKMEHIFRDFKKTNTLNLETWR